MNLTRLVAVTACLLTLYITGCKNEELCNETVAAGCEFSSELASELGCSGGGNPGCAGLCGAVAVGCGVEVDAVVDCGIVRPASDYVCNEKGYPEPKEGVCAVESIALVTCWVDGGPNESVAAACQNERDLAQELGCANPRSSRCVAFYLGLLAGCDSEVDALVVCGLDLPSSDYFCNEDGDVQPKPGVCEEEAAALIECQLEASDPTP